MGNQHPKQKRKTRTPNNHYYPPQIKTYGGYSSSDNSWCVIGGSTDDESVFSDSSIDDQKTNDDIKKDFAGWFKQIGVMKSESEFKIDADYVADNYPTDKTIEPQEPGADDGDGDENKERLVQLILDVLGANHQLYSDKINEEYLCSLGISENMKEENITNIIQSLSDKMPSTQLSEILDGAEGADNKFDSDADFTNIPTNFISKIKPGLIVWKGYTKIITN